MQSAFTKNEIDCLHTVKMKIQLKFATISDRLPKIDYMNTVISGPIIPYLIKKEMKILTKEEELLFINNFGYAETWVMSEINQIKIQIKIYNHELRDIPWNNQMLKKENSLCVFIFQETERLLYIPFEDISSYISNFEFPYFHRNHLTISRWAMDKIINEKWTYGTPRTNPDKSPRNTETSLNET